MNLVKIKFRGAVLIITIFLNVIKQGHADGISCFKCFPSQPGYKETDLLCSQFDGSSRFQVYCPSSTLCMKKTIYHRFKNSVTMAVQRDCAPQKRTVHTYSDVDNAWHNKEEIVKTAYDEGCFIGEDKGTPTDPPEYCFCSFHLCNSTQSSQITNTYHIFALTVAFLFLTLI